MPKPWNFLSYFSYWMGGGIRTHDLANNFLPETFFKQNYQNRAKMEALQLTS